MQTMLALLAVSVTMSTAGAEPIPVEVVQTAQGWSLMRGGKPYYIRGAGGDEHLDLLVEMGGNSIRTWHAEQLEPRQWPDGRVASLLDIAHEKGLTVCAGFWVAHPEGGFRPGEVDYDNPAHVQRQIDDARAFVRKWKDHPAILMWGVGNEATGTDDRRAFQELEKIARVFKKEDPNHPTMTAIPTVWPNRAGLFDELCPSIDIFGLNAYSALPACVQVMEEQGYKGPYVVTEYGPIGPWESARTPWGAEVEQSSAGKARTYVEFHRAGVANMPHRALGGYAFLWGHKQERTETWFGMFLESGEKTATVDAMGRIWGGSTPMNHAPLVEGIRSELALRAVAPGRTVTATVDATDPDGDDLRVRWVVRRESTDKKDGGAPERKPETLDGVLRSSAGLRAKVRVPREPGAYRLFSQRHPDTPVPSVRDAARGIRPARSRWLGGRVQPRRPRRRRTLLKDHWSIVNRPPFAE